MARSPTAILWSHVFDGPNVELPCRAIHMAIDVGRLPRPDGRLCSAVRDTLLDRVRQRRDDALSAGFEKAFATQAGLETGMAVGLLTLELQRLFDGFVEGVNVRPPDAKGRIVVTYAYDRRDFGLLAGRAACDLLVWASGRPACGADLPARLDRLVRTGRGQAGDDLMRPLMREVVRRGIPYLRLNDGAHFAEHVLLGQGVRQRQFSGTISDGIGAVSSLVTGSKRHTCRMLERVGVPVPRHYLVQSPAQALQAARLIGYPVVVKPERGSGGKGITAGVRDDAEMTQAYLRARKRHRDVVVEEFLEGEDHRCLVSQGRLVAATQRRRASVTGDGRRTIRSLIDEVNSDPRRGPAGVSVLVILTIDEAMLDVLQRQDLGLDDVPQEGRVVLLRGTSNIKSGGTPVDVTVQVHPDNRRMVELAAATLNLEFTGIDVLFRDISRSYLDQRCAVVEVNTYPSINFYDLVDGDRWGVTKAFVETMIPPDSDGRIPLIAVVATSHEDAADIASRIAELLAAAGVRTARSDGTSLWLAGDLVRGDFETVAAAAKAVWAHPHAEAGVLSLPASAVLNHGLPWDACSVVVADGVAADGQAMAAMAVAAGAAMSGVVSIGDERLRRMVAMRIDGCRHSHLDGDTATTDHAGLAEAAIALLDTAVQ